MSGLRAQQDGTVGIEYTTLEGTKLIHEPRFGEAVAVELVGGFTLSLRQGAGGVRGRISRLHLASRDGENPASYTVMGSGTYAEACDLRVNPTAIPPNPSFLYLEASINEIEGVRLHAEFSLNPAVFPALDQVVFRDGIVFHEQDAFMLRLVAEPRRGAAGAFFRRGDVSGDGDRGIVDAVLLLMFLLRALDEPACVDAADANDDGRVDPADVIALLQHLFVGGAPLSVPSSFCGLDETVDDLGCEEAGVCSAP